MAISGKDIYAAGELLSYHVQNNVENYNQILQLVLLCVRHRTNSATVVIE